MTVTVPVTVSVVVGNPKAASRTHAVVLPTAPRQLNGRLGAGSAAP